MEEFQPPRAPKRYQPPPGADGSPVRKPLPKLYGTHRWLGYWYVPAGMALVLFHRTLRLWLSARLPPRHLKRVRVRQRSGGGKHDGG